MFSDHSRTCIAIASVIFLLLTDSASASPKTIIHSYTYVLQADKMSKTKAAAIKLLKNSKRDLIILDPFYKPGTRWSAKDLATIRSGQTGRKVVAYLSIAEAENYRQYWLPSWENPDTRPDYILEENPDWPGNFKVSYWKKPWQKILLAELEQIMQTGFDGVFLDIVDAFEYFEYNQQGNYTDNKLNPDTGNSYRSDMIELIRSIHQKLTTGNRNYLLIPQNGTQLLQSQSYQDLISLQAVEDLFTNGNSKQPLSHSTYILSFLNSLQSSGKGVLLTEYPTSKKFCDLAIRKSAEHDITLLLTSRDLGKLGRSIPPKK